MTTCMRLSFSFFFIKKIQIVPNESNMLDDVVNLTSELHGSNAQMNHLCKRNDLTESTGVVPAKYPPKVKLELFSQL